MDKISVITIVFNDENNIAMTMNSVFKQTYSNIEYILIDGKSSDGTLDIILNVIKNVATITKQENLDNRFYLEATKMDNPSFSIKLLSQKDNGIYDAMNKGIDLSSGIWCNFMNSGDVFYANTTIADLFNQYRTKGIESDIIYGDSQMIYDTNHTKILTSITTNHKYKHHFSHQASFISTALMKKYHYDTSFKIAGDTDFFAKAYNNNARFLHQNVVVCKFNLTGISSTLSLQMFKEECKVGYKYNKLFPIMHFFVFVFWYTPRFIIRKILPKSIVNKARIIFSKKKL